MFAVFDVIEDETEMSTEPFRHRYLEADAAAEPKKMPRSRLTVRDRRKKRIFLFRLRCEALDLFAAHLFEVGKADDQEKNDQ